MQVPLRTENAAAQSPIERLLAAQGFEYAFSKRRASLVVVDGAVIFVALSCSSLIAPYIFSSGVQSGTPWYWFLALASGWWLFAGLNDLYDIPSLHKRAWLLQRLVLVSAIGLAACLSLIFFRRSNLTVEHLTIYMIVAAPLMLLWRMFYITTLSFSALSHRTLIVGQGMRARLAADLVRQESFLNYDLVGYVDGKADKPTLARDGLPIWGNLADLPRLAREFHIHEIIIATEEPPAKELALSLIDCQAHGIELLWFPELYERHRRNVPIKYIDPDWALEAVRTAPTLLQRFIKRFLDLTIVVFALPFILIVMPLLMVIIKLDSPGAVFYRQVRLGRAGVPFLITKFRSMRVNAEKNGEAVWATKDDPRITRVGRFLRKTRLDELPQIWNILRGEMSFIGPRPERPEFIEELEQHIPYYRVRLLVKPGLTGWAQVQYDYTSSVEDSYIKLQYDLYYVHRWSLWLDLYILFRTVAVVLQFKGM